MITKEVAEQIAQVIRWADRGCHSCVEQLCVKASCMWPEYKFELVEDSDELVLDGYWDYISDEPSKSIAPIVKVTSTDDHTP